jgi:sphingosine kinase
LLVDQKLVGKHATIIPVRQVLWAEVDSSKRVTLRVSVLGRKKKSPKSPLTLVRLAGEVQDGEENRAKEWSDALMHLAYEGMGVKRQRKLRVLLNPHGGKVSRGATLAAYLEYYLISAGQSGQRVHQEGRSYFRSCAHYGGHNSCGILILINLVYDLVAVDTTHAKHAVSLTQSLPLDVFDALVAVSGDGLLYECINGLATHTISPKRALKIPLAPIPTGSANGTSINVLGVDVCH